ncbi:hypothetical protein SAMN06265349_10189 [Flavobacterium resistens]|uniref:Uncharacterized protein n=1 Tax=Flavobacterium resistens TaxID=443612 RepID=A0A521AF91_9FLAO|nr:hypothetical protein SAMN06265349_10189 [Flavobacterium resistens]
MYRKFKNFAYLKIFKNIFHLRDSHAIKKNTKILDLNSIFWNLS